MSISSKFAAIAASVVLAAGVGVTLAGQQQPAPQTQKPGHGQGRLVIWGDVALFEKPGTPNNCILTNRFTRGQRIGFRMTAVDGGTGEPENTATLTVHVNYMGKTIDVPMRYRGGGTMATLPKGYLRVPNELWTGFWTVPMDAPTGMVTYTVTATDAFGRKATFQTFPYESSQIHIVS